MEPIRTYDAIVIGSGQAGTPLSKFLAMEGLRTLLIEKRWVGGTCVNDGCSPTKAMVASARTAWLAHQSESMGVNTGSVSVDIKTIIDRQQKIVHQMRSGSETGLKETDHLKLLYGEARFTAAKVLSVSTPEGETIQVSAEKIFINTGLKPVIPDIPGLDQVPYLTNTSLLTYRELPGKLLILGAGYIGLEFAQMYRRFGSQVVVLERKSRILEREDSDIAKELTSILLEEGIEIKCNSSLKSVRTEGEAYKATIVQNGEDTEIEFTHLLIATGRKPELHALQLNATGVEVDDQGYVQVNDYLETNVQGIFALGDIKGGPAFTHVSYDDYRIVTDALFKDKYRSYKNRILPYCMFTDPQLGRVGITEQEAKRRKLNYRQTTLPNSYVARSIETGDTRGMMKAIVDADTDLILGASILGTEGGEVVSVIQMAMLGGLTWRQLSTAMLAHPTFSESLNNLFSKLE